MKDDLIARLEARIELHRHKTTTTDYELNIECLAALKELMALAPPAGGVNPWDRTGDPIKAAD